MGRRTALFPTLDRNGFEAVPLAADLDEAVFRFVVEDDGGVARFGLGEHLDAVAAGRFRVGVNAGYEVWVEPDLGRREVPRVECGDVAVPDPDDLMPSGMPCSRWSC